MNLYDLIVAKKLSGGGGGGGGGSEIETGTWTPSGSSVTREFIPFSESHSDLPSIVILSLTQSNADNWGNNKVTRFQYIDYYKLFGKGFNTEKSATDGFGYSLVEVLAWYNSGSATTLYKIMTSHNSSDSGNADKTYPRYFVSESGFYATADFKSTSQVFVKSSSSSIGEWQWIAIWT